MLRVVAIALTLSLVGLQARLWVADGGYAELHRLDDQIAAVEDHNADLARRNRVMAAEIENLKSGDAAIEGRARADLGMIRDGERFYLIVDRD